MLFPVKCKGNRGILLIENKPIWIVYQPILIYLSVLLQLLKVSIMKDIFIMIKRTFILLLFISLYTSLFAGSFRHLNVREGLSSRQVYQICKDSTG